MSHKPKLVTLYGVMQTSYMDQTSWSKALGEVQELYLASDTDMCN